MKAILINPELKQITEVEIEKGIDAIYKTMNCEMVGAFPINNNGDSIFYDDEGLFKEQKGGFMMPDWSYPVVGKCLVIGSDINTGESTDVTIHVNYFKRILWIDENRIKAYQEQFI